MPTFDNARTADETRSPPGTERAQSDIVDVADGIDRIMGDRALFVRMLARFRGEYGEGAAPILAALAAGDRTVAHRRVHTLKGAAGMIGARRLHGLASDVEVAIRTDAPNEADAVAQLAPEFALVHQVLDRLLAAGIMASPPRNGPPKPLLHDGALLARLVELLVAGDGAAVDLLEESAASLQVILGESRLRQVTTAVNEFDYDSALQALRQNTQAG
jgi:HPt (histidine-containing phosphotransfer) domain-containing protein